jgi:hypothetical protein
VGLLALVVLLATWGFAMSRSLEQLWSLVDGFADGVDSAVPADPVDRPAARLSAVETAQVVAEPTDALVPAPPPRGDQQDPRADMPIVPLARADILPILDAYLREADAAQTQQLLQSVDEFVDLQR